MRIVNFSDQADSPAAFTADTLKMYELSGFRIGLERYEFVVTVAIFA
ncbi:hypothetical protein ABE169_19845 [Bacillus subtilis]